MDNTNTVAVGTIVNAGGYVAYKVDGVTYPIKNINTPYSRYSQARWLKANQKPGQRVLNGTPVIQITPNILGNITYHVYNNTLEVPMNLAYTPTLGYK